MTEQEKRIIEAILNDIGLEAINIRVNDQNAKTKPETVVKTSR